MEKGDALAHPPVPDEEQTARPLVAQHLADQEGNGGELVDAIHLEMPLVILNPVFGRHRRMGLPQSHGLGRWDHCLGAIGQDRRCLYLPPYSQITGRVSLTTIDIDQPWGEVQLVDELGEIRYGYFPGLSLGNREGQLTAVFCPCAVTIVIDYVRPELRQDRDKFLPFRGSAQVFVSHQLGITAAQLPLQRLQMGVGIRILDILWLGGRSPAGAAPAAIPRPAGRDAAA